MKNLKKVLSLALAFAMVLGLCVVGSAATQDVTTLADWDEVEDKDAALLLNTFNIMQGDDEGFRPNDNVKRTEAAKMISVALWGGSDDAALYSSSNIGGYPDVVSGSWYMGYVNYMTVQGIMQGDDAGTFRPDGNVTGYELLKMCLVALGYNAETESLVGAGWDIRTMALATKPGFVNLTAGTTVENWNAPLTRMNAATIIANMIYRETVIYSLQSAGGTSTTTRVAGTGDTFAEAVLNMEVEEGTLVANEYGTIPAPNNTTITPIDTSLRAYAGQNAIIEYVTTRDDKGDATAWAQANRVMNTSLEDLGKPVTVFLVGSKIISTVVADTTEVAIEYNSTYTAIANLEEKPDTQVALYADGDAVTEGVEAAILGKSFDPASEVHSFDTNGNGYIDLVTTYTFDENLTVGSVATSDTYGTVYMLGTTAWSESKYAASGTNSVKTNAVLADDTSFGDELEAGDEVVFITLDNCFKGGSFKHGYALTPVEGKVTRLSTDGKTIYIDGVKYSAVKDMEVSVGSEKTFLTYADGTIAKVKGEDTKELTEYALVYDAGYEQIGTGTGVGSSTSVIVEVAVVLPDGTDKVYEVKSVYNTSNEEIKVSAYKTSSQISDTSNPLFGTGGILTSIQNKFGADEPYAETSINKLMKYELNSDGTITLYDETLSTNLTYNKTYINGSAKIGTGTSDEKFIVSSTVTYIQTSNTSTDGEKWVVYKGTALPTFTTVSTTPSPEDNAVATTKRYSDDDTAAYIMLGANSYEHDTFGEATETSIFYIVSAPEIVSTNPTTYEASIYNGETDKVGTVQYTGTPGAKGEIYTKFSTTTGFNADDAVALDSTNLNYGFITGFGDGTIQLYNFLNGGGERSSQVYLTSKTTNYYYIDGADTHKMDVKDVAAQIGTDEGKGMGNKYQALVTLNGDKDTVTSVIVFDAVQGAPLTAYASDSTYETTVVAKDEDVETALKEDEYKGLAVSTDLTVSVTPGDGKDEYNVVYTGSPVILTKDNRTGFPKEYEGGFVVALQFPDSCKSQTPEITNIVRRDGTTGEGVGNPFDDDNTLLLFGVGKNVKSCTISCGGVTFNLDFSGVTMPAE